MESESSSTLRERRAPRQSQPRLPSGAPSRTGARSETSTSNKLDASAVTDTTFTVCRACACRYADGTDIWYWRKSLAGCSESAEERIFRSLDSSMQ